MTTDEPSFDLGALESIAKRALTVSSDIGIVFRALPDLVLAARRDAEWRRVYAMVWSIIHGERVDTPLPPIGPRGLISAAAEFSAMRSAMNGARAAQTEAENQLSICRRDFDERGRILTAANARIAALEGLNPPETTA